MSRQIAIPVQDSSQVGEARRFAVATAQLAGFDETSRGKIAIVATEMANNLARYATRGELLIQTLQTGSGPVVELLSIDSGPGMADVARSLQDGYSTGGTAGNGLGAIQRLSAEFDIFSRPAEGTVILSRIPKIDTQWHRDPFSIGGVSIPVSGETVCGDAWNNSQSGDVLRLMIADGLGHGPLAEEAALAAVNAFKAQSGAEPSAVLEEANRALSGTRGAAMAVVMLDVQAAKLKYAGIGNIAGTLIRNEGNQGLISNNGIVGNRPSRRQQFEYACGSGGLLVMHSDGLRSRWTLNDYAGLCTRHPAIIAGVLYRDYRRGRDDATVVVVRFGSART